MIRLLSLSLVALACTMPVHGNMSTCVPMSTGENTLRSPSCPWDEGHEFGVDG